MLHELLKIALWTNFKQVRKWPSFSSSLTYGRTVPNYRRASLLKFKKKTNTKFKYPFFENTPKYVINKYIEIFLLVKYLSHVLSIRRKFLDLKNHNWITGNESLMIWCYTIQLRVFSIPLVLLIWGMLIYPFPISMFQISDKY